MTIIWYMVPEIMKCNRLNFFVILGHFFLFPPRPPPPNCLKNEKFKKMIKMPSLFYTIVPKIIMLYCSWDMAHDRCNCSFSLSTIFCPFIPLTAQKIKIPKKNEKNTWRYHHFTQLYQKLLLHNLWFLRFGAQQTYRRTDGKSDI